MCTVAAVLMAGATIGKGVMDYQAGSFNNKVAQQDAQRMRQLGAVEEAALRREQDYQLGQQQVDLAASGRSTQSGSALELAFRSKLEGEHNALLKRTGTIMRSDARINEGKMAKFQGTQSLIGSGFSAANQLLQEAAEAYKMPALG